MWQSAGGFILALVLSVPAWPATAPPVVDQCDACHKDPHFYVQNRKLYAYYQDWINSPHAVSGLGCSDCHGGDSSSADFDVAHSGVLDLRDPEHMLYYRNQPDTCGACHADKAARFRTSKHYAALLGDSVAPTCTTCHRAMNRRPYYRDILIDACTTCHSGEHEGSLPPVTGQVKEYLQRLNIAKGYLGWTTLHYESLGWPTGSRCEVDEIRKKFEDAVARVHSFDLAQMDESTTEILTELKLIFQRIWDEQNRKAPFASPPD